MVVGFGEVISTAKCLDNSKQTNGDAVVIYQTCTSISSGVVSSVIHIPGTLVDKSLSVIARVPKYTCRLAS